MCVLKSKLCLISQCNRKVKENPRLHGRIFTATEVSTHQAAPRFTCQGIISAPDTILPITQAVPQVNYQELVYTEFLTKSCLV